jgi:voltage-gated potassium channel
MNASSLSPWRQKLHQVVWTQENKAGLVFDLTVQSLIVFSLICFSIETLPFLRQDVRHLLQVCEIVVTLLFTLEYILRLASATHPLKYAFSFLGIVDLLAILPFYLSPAVDLRSLRAFRLLRLFRLLKLARYSQAMTRFYRALMIARAELVLYGAFTMVVIYLAACGIYFFEHEEQPVEFASVFHSLWWAVTTLTTVGYGDVYPVTLGGRIFTFFVLLAGLGIVAVPAGLVVSALAEARKMEEEQEGDEEVSRKREAKAKEGDSG